MQKMFLKSLLSNNCLLHFLAMGLALCSSLTVLAEEATKTPDWLRKYSPKSSSIKLLGEVSGLEVWADSDSAAKVKGTYTSLIRDVLSRLQVELAESKHPIWDEIISTWKNSAVVIAPIEGGDGLHLEKAELESSEHVFFVSEGLLENKYQFQRVFALELFHAVHTRIDRSNGSEKSDTKWIREGISVGLGMYFGYIQPKVIAMAQENPHHSSLTNIPNFLTPDFKDPRSEVSRKYGILALFFNYMLRNCGSLDWMYNLLNEATNVTGAEKFNRSLQSTASIKGLVKNKNELNSRNKKLAHIPQKANKILYKAFDMEVCKDFETLWENFSTSLFLGNSYSQSKHSWSWGLAIHATRATPKNRLPEELKLAPLSFTAYKVGNQTCREYAGNPVDSKDGEICVFSNPNEKSAKTFKKEI